ncbi:MAG: ATP synthase F1 subunit delta [Candidatus Paceibacterota bacterium]|jgi:F-type H+-transporting ATPase subunit delta
MKKTDNDIIEAIYQSIKGKGESELIPLFKNIARFLYNRRLLHESDNIISKLEKLINEREGRVSAKIISTSPIPKEGKRMLSEMLKKRYKKNEAELEEVIDKKLLGGLKIEVEDEILDNTISGKLTKLQGQLTT